MVAQDERRSAAGAGAVQEMTGAAAVMRSLESAGVECLFGYPGGQAIKLFDALYDTDLRFYLMRHEQAAVHAADGYARATGKPGVVLVTSGPGATNTLTGIATAYMDSVPLVVISGQVPTSVIGTDSFQEADIFGMSLPVVKHSYLLRDAADLPRTFAEAFHVASTGRPGPVLIDVPSDVASQTCFFEWPETLHIPSYKPTERGNQKQLRKAAAALLEAKRPLVIAGGGLVGANASAQLVELAELLGIPVVCTLMGKTALPSKHPLNLGHVGMHGSRYAIEALSNCDLLVCLGTHLSDRVTGRLEHFASQAHVIHVDVDPAEISKVVYADIPIVGDVGLVLSDLLELLGKQKPKPQTEEWLSDIAQWRTRWPFFDTAVEASAGGIVPEKVMMELSRQLGGEGIVCTDVGQHQMWAAQFVECDRPRSFITSGGLGTMGFGLPAAIGAALAKPGEQIVCISGDGSFQMNIQEMATVRELGLPVKVLLVDNGVLGMVRQWQTLFYERRFSGTCFGGNPDFVALAEAYGWQAQRVEDPDDVPSALGALISADGPYLLDVVVSPDANVYPMVPPGGAGSDALGAIDLAVGAVRLGVEHARTMDSGEGQAPKAFNFEEGGAS